MKNPRPSGGNLEIAVSFAPRQAVGVSRSGPTNYPTKNYGKWPFIVDLPMKHGDFPVRYVKSFRVTFTISKPSGGWIVLTHANVDENI